MVQIFTSSGAVVEPAHGLGMTNSVIEAAGNVAEFVLVVLPAAGAVVAWSGSATIAASFAFLCGSYAGLAAAMALGRARKQVLVIDSGMPCNRQTPHSHNFLTQDGRAPAEIAAIARRQVENYDTISFLENTAVKATYTGIGFRTQTASGEEIESSKLIFASGIRDLLPPLEGLAECWGISVLHCPFCHGYEIRNDKTGILGRGEAGFEMARFIANWTKDLTLFSNGPSALTAEQKAKLEQHQIAVVENEIARLAHAEGELREIVFKDRTTNPLKAFYVKAPFEQHCKIPQALGCELTADGFLRTDESFETTVKGVYACGDTLSAMRTVAHAVSTGTATGIILAKRIIMENF